MSPKKIRVGQTYVNRGAGRTKRTVLGIGDEFRPIEWLTDRPRPEEPGVFYQQGDYTGRLYLSMFASWAGREA